MKVDQLKEYGIPEKYIEKFKEEKIQKLYKPQADVIKEGLFKERNIIVSLPTASGKTLIATTSMIHKLNEGLKRKVVYIAPLVALASEKYNYFKKFFDKDYRVGLSIGDLDSSEPWLANCDVICITTEKLDSLLRHNVEWTRKIGLIIVDEIHMLNDSSRGPTLEILLTKLIHIVPSAQILGLSATISNSDELAKWLNAALIVSDFRPVKLYEGVAFDSKLHFDEKEGYELDGSLEIENAIASNTLDIGKQMLIFTSTRKFSESLAERLGKTVSHKLTYDDKSKLSLLSSEIENVLEYPTHQCRELSYSIKHGVAFHHAGLMRKQKHLIEENFRNGTIKIIVATPTLAMGVNLPAFRVLIRDTKRYYQGIGSEYIPVLEYKQFVGRAGRPSYDKFGESILLAKSEGEAKDLIKHYIFGQPENIISKLGMEPVLRTHILALIASGFCGSHADLIKFFNKTFYAHHYGNIADVENGIGDVLKKLIEWKFIDSDGMILKATRIGNRVSQLYIDPLTAHIYLDAIGLQKERTDFSFIQLVSNSMELRPLVSVKNSELEDLERIILNRHNQILLDIPEEYDMEFEEFLKSMKTAIMFEKWTNEVTEEKIMTDFKIAPGELYNKLLIMDWLIYSLNELSLLSGKKELLLPLRKLRVRLKYGIKEELLPLVKLKGIGRVRARKLFNANLSSIEKLRDIKIENLAHIIGSKLATEIKNQVSQKENKKEQSSLTDVE